MDVNVLRSRVGMRFQKPNPLPCPFHDGYTGPQTHGVRSKARLMRLENPCGTPPSGTKSRIAWNSSSALQVRALQQFWHGRTRALDPIGRNWRRS